MAYRQTVRINCQWETATFTNLPVELCRGEEGEKNFRVFLMLGRCSSLRTTHVGVDIQLLIMETDV